MKPFLRQIPGINRLPLDLLVPMAERAALLVLVACAAGLIVNSFHPMGLPIVLGRVPHPGIPVWVWNRVHVVNARQAHDLWKNHGTIFVDVRDAKDFKIGHIPDSSPRTPTLSLPYHEFTRTFPTLRASLPERGPMLIYCYGSECGLAMRVVKRFFVMGHDNLSSLEGGIAGWGRAGYELTGPLAHRGVIQGRPTPAEGGAKR